MDVRTEASAITSRRYGAVNWMGLQTLVTREITRFIKVGMQTLFAPLVQTLLFMMVFSLVRQGFWPDTTRPYADGLAAGLVMMSITSNAFANSSSSMAIAKVQGSAVDFLMPPLSALELTVAFVLGAAARGLMVGIVSMIAIAWIADVVPVHPLIALYFAMCGALIFGSIGLIGGIWAEKFDHLSAVTNFVIMPLTFLSGTFYSTDGLTEPLKSISHHNPVFFLMDGFRFAFIDAHDAPLATSAIVCGVLAALLCVAAWLVIKSGYKLRS